MQRDSQNVVSQAILLGSEHLAMQLSMFGASWNAPTFQRSVTIQV